MARSKKTVTTVKTPEQKMSEAKEQLVYWGGSPLPLIPRPTRIFSIGEKVRVGHLMDVVILEQLEGGMAYLYSFTHHERNQEPVTEYRASYWTEIDKDADTTGVPSLFSPYQRHHAINSDLGSIIHHITTGGLVCDTRYQRGYVWSEENKDALIESIFDRLDIGSFLFVRHSGFLHKEDHTIRPYRTIDGREVKIKRCDDYTTAIIDGQQRLTTMIDFLLDRRPYKGICFSQMNIRDQHEFTSTPVMFRIIDEGSVSEKEVVRMFLQSNRGVPQAPEHLAKVQAFYDSME